MPAGMSYPPERIVCLTEETVETLYLLGEDARIVGVSGYAVRPARVRKEKPRVSAFTSADTGKILALEPDLVLAFSDLQADIVADLIRRGLAVHVFNQRSVSGILAMVCTLGAIVGASTAAKRLAGELAARVDAIRTEAASAPVRPRVYFEEWDEPMISGIGWVSELIDAAGGTDVFADRAGFSAIPAVRDGALHEIKAPLILQPGPAALTDGLAALRAIVVAWNERLGQPAATSPASGPHEQGSV